MKTVRWFALARRGYRGRLDGPVRDRGRHPVGERRAVIISQVTVDGGRLHHPGDHHRSPAAAPDGTPMTARCSAWSRKALMHNRGRLHDGRLYVAGQSIAVTKSGPDHVHIGRNVGPGRWCCGFSTSTRRGAAVRGRARSRLRVCLMPERTSAGYRLRMDRSCRRMEAGCLLGNSLPGDGRDRLHRWPAGAATAGRRSAPCGRWRATPTSSPTRRGATTSRWCAATWPTPTR